VFPVLKCFFCLFVKIIRSFSPLLCIKIFENLQASKVTKQTKHNLLNCFQQHQKSEQQKQIFDNFMSVFEAFSINPISQHNTQVPEFVTIYNLFSYSNTFWLLFCFGIIHRTCWSKRKALKTVQQEKRSKFRTGYIINSLAAILSCTGHMHRNNVHVMHRRVSWT